MEHLGTQMEVRVLPELGKRGLFIQSGLRLLSGEPLPLQAPPIDSRGRVLHVVRGDLFLEGRGICTITSVRRSS